MVKFLNFGRKKKEDYKPDLTGVEKTPKVLGFINPIWNITVSHKGKEILSQPFCFMLATYLKDYGLEPEKYTDPSLCVTINIGGPEIKIPLYTSEKVEFGKKYTPEEAIKKGLVYKSQARS